MNKNNIKKSTIKDKRINLLHPTMHKDPYATYKRIRENHPVCQVEPNGLWVISRYRDVSYALQHPEIFSSKGTADTLLLDWIIEATTVPNNILSVEDKPQHTQHRKPASNYFTHKAIDQLKPFMQETAEVLVDKVEENNPSNFLTDIAYPYTEKIINRFIGISEDEKYDKLCEWVELIERPPQEPNVEYAERLNRHNHELSANCQRLIQSRHQIRKNDLICELIHAGIDDKTLSSEWIVEFIKIIYRASIHPSGHLLARAMLRLSQDNALVKQLKSQPEKISSFIVELIRYDFSGHTVPRRTCSEVSLSGVSIPKNSDVLLILAAANRDPEQFVNPDTFDISRHNNKAHLSFSTGIHRCFGEELAKTQISFLVETLLRLFSNITCPPPDQLPWFYNLTTHSISNLQVKFS
jgi:cytochrome P450